MLYRFNSAFKHLLLLDTLAALGVASIEEIVNVLQQLQNEAFEEEKQQQISNEQFQELLNGINFDEPIEENKNTQPEYIELVQGIDFDEPIEEEQNKTKPTPILAPFCSTEEKKQDNEMCNKISSTSTRSFEVSKVRFFKKIYIMYDRKISLLILLIYYNLIILL